MSIFKEKRCHQASAGSWKDGFCREIKTATTTDATATVIYSVPVAELECAVVQATGVAFKTDASAGLAHRVLNFGRRATGGNVTVGTTNSQLVEDSAGSPLLTLTANTTAQTVEVKVTGVASETWHWEVEIQYCVAK